MSSALVWIRRDIRLHDHHALSQALEDHDQVYLCFVFDKNILEPLPKKDKRLTFIHQGLKEISQHLLEHGSDIEILHGDPTEEIPRYIEKCGAKALYYNRDYEPYALKRDQKVTKTLKDKGVTVKSFKDSVLFEKEDILNKQGGIYKVFTPYKRAWYEKFREDYGSQIPQYSFKYSNLAPHKVKKSISNNDWHQSLGFEEELPPLEGGVENGRKHLSRFRNHIQDYEKARDFPALEKTSNMSPYIRHGMVSVRDLLRRGLEDKTSGHQIWTSEVIWREFYQMILANFPHVQKKCFKPEYDNIKWIGGTKELKAWKEGQTGFPIVDAAMRCLNETGMMHNRLRMIVASFLCKTLLVNWKKGEEYFALKLLDFDLAANNGGWQWSASTGTDAQPYFRIFNPTSQSEKFDPDGEFIKKWCPELSGFSKKRIHEPSKADMLEQAEAKCTLGEHYPFPVVDYKLNRQKALDMYKEGIK